MNLRKVLIPLVLAPACVLGGCNANDLGFNSNATQKEVSKYVVPLSFISTPSPRPLSLTEEQQAQIQATIKDFVTHCEKVANQGDAAMQYELGLMYMHGFLTPVQQQVFFKGIQSSIPSYLCKSTKDMDKAVYWIDKAIRSGNETALSTFFLFDSDEVISKRPQIRKAIQFLANKGNNAAKVALGLTYLNDTWGVEESPENALKYIRTNMDEPLAKYGLGFMYLTNTVVDEAEYRDREKGLSLLDAAAQQGSELAVKDLAFIKYVGIFGDADHAKSLNCFAILIQKYPFEFPWLKDAALILRELKSPEADAQYGQFFKVALLNTLYADIETSRDALFRLNDFAKQDRLGFSYLEFRYFADIYQKYGIEGAQEVVQRDNERFKRVKQNVDNGAVQYATQLLFYYSRIGENNVPNPHMAQHYALVAEKYDNADNLDLLATLYLLGIDLPYNPNKAVELLERSKAKGSEYATTLYNSIYNHVSQTPNEPYRISPEILSIMLKRNFNPDLS